jgi:hypothetical protein
MCSHTALPNPNGMSRPGGFSLAAQAPAGLSEREQHVLRERLLEKAGREGALPSEFSMLGGPLFRLVRGRSTCTRRVDGCRGSGIGRIAPIVSAGCSAIIHPRGFPRRAVVQGQLTPARSHRTPFTSTARIVAFG